MQYRIIYDQLIDHAKATNNDSGPYEKHHIIPKSLGGSNLKNNIVKLTPRQHFVAHRLLTKFLIGADKHKMIFAVKRMATSNKRKLYNINSRTYEWLRIQHNIAASIVMKGRKPSDDTIRKQSIAQRKRYALTPTHWKDRQHDPNSIELIREANIGKNNHQYGKPRTTEERLKISLTMKGRKKSKETIEKFKNRKDSEETKRKKSDAAKLRWTKHKNEIMG
jgi:hypothetical protein